MAETRPKPPARLGARVRVGRGDAARVERADVQREKIREGRVGMFVVIISGVVVMLKEMRVLGRPRLLVVAPALPYFTYWPMRWHAGQLAPCMARSIPVHSVQFTTHTPSHATTALTSPAHAFGQQNVCACRLCCISCMCMCARLGRQLGNTALQAAVG